MGTRAVITFIDEHDTHHVYKHWDGNPVDILQGIERATAYAWPLPRFESDEFATAFIAANKPKGGGDIRMSHTYEDSPDLAYRYEVRLSRGKLDVRAFTPIYGANGDVAGWAKYAIAVATT